MLARLRSAIRPVLLIALVVPAGCGGGVEMAEVEGVLLLSGKPGHKVEIQFIPDVDKGTLGPVAYATTDAEGKFRLEVREKDGATRAGAVVGWHRVILSDQQLAESATGKGVPIRFGADYGRPGATPLQREVKKGTQTIEIRVP